MPRPTGDADQGAKRRCVSDRAESAAGIGPVARSVVRWMEQHLHVGGSYTRCHCRATAGTSPERVDRRQRAALAEVVQRDDQVVQSLGQRVGAIERQQHAVLGAIA